MSELYPGSIQTPAMLVSKCPTDWKKKLESGDYIGSEKKDGHFFQIEVTDDGTVYLFGRSKSKKTGELSEKIANVPHIKEWAEENLPKGTIIIGEIYRVGETSKAVTSIMGCLSERAIQRQFGTDEYGGPIHYYIHDIIRWDGQDLTEIPYNDRIVYIENLDRNDYIEIAETYTDNLESQLQAIFDAGGEGMVFRHKDSIYKPGKRPKEVFKIKTEETIDCVIMGFVDPVMEYTGKEIETWKYWAERTEIDSEGNYHYSLWYSDDGTAYKHHQHNPHIYIPVTKAFFHRWKAGFIVGLYDDNGVLCPVGNITSGMTDYLRETTADYPAQYLDHVIEIQCMSVDKNEHTIRHGRFIRMRDDKNPEDCTMESVFK